MVKPLERKTDLSVISSGLSPVFDPRGRSTGRSSGWWLGKHRRGLFNGVLITGGLGVRCFELNFLVYYLVPSRNASSESASLPTFIGKCLSLYLINTYQAALNQDKIWGTYSTPGIGGFRILLMVLPYGISSSGVVPCIYLFARRFRLRKLEAVFRPHGPSHWRFLLPCGCNMQNWPWMTSNAPNSARLVMPWSYTAFLR